MERRIKIIHLLTLIASAALFAAQIYWLYSQYEYSLQRHEEELFAKTLELADVDRKLRESTMTQEVFTKIKLGMNNGDLTWDSKTYVVDREKPDSIEIDSQNIDSLYNQKIQGIKQYQIRVLPNENQTNIGKALKMFQINITHPFKVTQFDSLLKANNLQPSTIELEESDSAIWVPKLLNHSSIIRPTMEITYPIDILKKQQVRIVYKLSISPVLKKMLMPLVCSVLLFGLLIFCLIYQINTIFRQQRIEDLRKNFLQTMIHELKRPIATLKMCVSFMKNDKMMQDLTMKDDILQTSHNELDNLSSYFSKLRDLMYGEEEEIPLNLSTFNLKELVEKCVGNCLDKQNVADNRQVEVKLNFEDDNFTITADKMHIYNIICNLLENAIKYSEGQTVINITCSLSDDKYRLEISDNGFGISSTECPYVFDKFFRSERLSNRDIPGIGLGLSYVKLLVAAHKGTITLKSVLGAGSIFIIEIPEKQ